jgi:hypothetical protein
VTGTAIAANDKAPLVPPERNRRGAIWVAQPQDVTHSFTVELSFRITEPLVDTFFNSVNGSDGLALVIHNDPRSSLAEVMGGFGGQLAYGHRETENAIQNSFAAAVRTYRHKRIELFTNGSDPDFAIRELATDGTPGFAMQEGSLGNMVGVTQHLTLTYTAADHSVALRLNDASIGLDHVPLPASLSSVVGGDTAYFGITASTGGYWSRIELSTFSASRSTSLLGDADNNDVVDHEDFLRLRSNFGKAGTFDDGDFNLNGVVDFPDFQILERNFGRTATGTVDATVGPAPSIPEPAHSAIILLVVASLRRGNRGGG